VRHEQPTSELLGERRQHVGRWRRLVDHLLRDPGEALDAAAQRLRHADERAPAVVQLAAADQDGADLGQLARGAGTAVRLDVDGEVLGFRGWCGQEIQGRRLYASPWTERVFALSRVGRPA